MRLARVMRGDIMISSVTLVEVGTYIALGETVYGSHTSVYDCTNTFIGSALAKDVVNLMEIKP